MGNKKITKQLNIAACFCSFFLVPNLVATSMKKTQEKKL